MTPKSFLFDIGNVLIGWDPSVLIERLLPDEDARAAFREEAMTDQRILAMDRGQSWDELLAEIRRDAPQHHPTARRYAERWIETVTGPIDGSVATLRALRGRGWPVYAFSNFGTENFEAALPHYPFLNEFDGRVISGYEGTVKPETAIFRIAARRFGLSPAETLFVDDRPENVDAAARLGFAVHLFQGPKGLIDDLAARGITVDP